MSLCRLSVAQTEPESIIHYARSMSFLIISRLANCFPQLIFEDLKTRFASSPVMKNLEHCMDILDTWLWPLGSQMLLMCSNIWWMMLFGSFLAIFFLSNLMVPWCSHEAQRNAHLISFLSVTDSVNKDFIPRFTCENFIVCHLTESRHHGWGKK